MFKKIASFFRNLDQQILTNFKDANLETRAVKSNGLWCCFLIPMILLVYSHMYQVPPLYKQAAYLSIGLLCYSLLFIAFTSVSFLAIKESVFGGCEVSSLMSAVLLYTIYGHGLITSMLLSLMSVYMYKIILRQCLVSFPKTFTIGELMIVLQGAVLFFVTAVSKLVHVKDTNKETIMINTVVYTVLTTVGLIVTALVYLRQHQRNLWFLLYIIVAAAVFALIVLHAFLGPACLVHIWHYIFHNIDRLRLFTFWLGLVLTSVISLVTRTLTAARATTATRKSFHLLASLVFLTGILIDVQFTRLAAGLALGVLVLAEALRKSGIEPISSALQSAFNIYKDDKDSGCFALTPLYLYLGLACPLVLVPGEGRLEELAGVLAVGVGDTAASFFGERYGINKWPDNNKTFEGTVFNIMSQITTVYMLKMFGLLDSPRAVVRTAVAASVNGLVEARTEQVDNLVLPLVMILAYQVTGFLAY